MIRIAMIIVAVIITTVISIVIVNIIMILLIGIIIIIGFIRLRVAGFLVSQDAATALVALL